MGIRLALAGDTMLGRGVAQELLAGRPPSRLVSAEVVEAARAADLVLLNLECCISERGQPWPRPDKPFFFRAPPVAVETLVHLGVRCVTLANNHALDFGEVALLDTLRHLRAAGIAAVGAGTDEEAARGPVVLQAGGRRLAVLGVTDHPEDFAAGPGRPGVAFADLRRGVPAWLLDAVREARSRADLVLVTPHWGPNMAPEPVPHVRRAAAALVDAGADLVAGHSAHVFQGVGERVLFDLGDFLDDYAADPVLRNDLGLLWLVDLEPGGPREILGLPLRVQYAHTRAADREDARWIERRLREACAPFGSRVDRRDGLLAVRRSSAMPRTSGGEGRSDAAE